MNKNLTLRMGNCPHRKYIPRLVDMVRSGVIDPTLILTQQEPMASAIDAYKAFDERKPGWIKVELEPQALAALEYRSRRLCCLNAFGLSLHPVLKGRAVESTKPLRG